MSRARWLTAAGLMACHAALQSMVAVCSEVIPVPAVTRKPSARPRSSVTTFVSRTPAVPARSVPAFPAVHSVHARLGWHCLSAWCQLGRFGTNFALFSEVADRVELCLFGPGTRRETRVELTEVDGFVWHCYLPGASAWWRLRVSGARSVRAGPGSPVRCGEAAARPVRQGRRGPGALARRPVLPPAVGAAEAISTRDSAPFMPRNVVINPYFDWAGDRPPRTPYHQTVIYEAHVRGLTLRHPGVPPGQRGTYAGLACPPVIEHLTRLGVTAIELMPVHQFISERQLAAAWPVQLLGLQHARVPRAAQRLLLPPPSPMARSPSSSRWSRRCTRRASR